MPASLKVIAQRAASSLETLQTSYDLAMLAINNQVPGDFVECGVFAGAQCAAMALAIYDMGDLWFLNHYKPRVHLFDSFSGVPAPGPEDKMWIEGGHPVGQSCATLEQVRSNMEEWGIDTDLLIWWPGRLENTLLGVKEGLHRPEQIAILRIDCDLYEPTKLCLEHLYPLVSPGGWIIGDDFGLDGARKALLPYMGGPVFWQK